MSKTFVFISLLILVIITPINTSNCCENDFSIYPKKLEENKINIIKELYILIQIIA